MDPHNYILILKYLPSQILNRPFFWQKISFIPSPARHDTVPSGNQPWATENHLVRWFPHQDPINIYIYMYYTLYCIYTYIYVYLYSYVGFSIAMTIRWGYIPGASEHWKRRSALCRAWLKNRHGTHLETSQKQWGFSMVYGKSIPRKIKNNRKVKSY